jgi:tetratricopeptide (TPR) repeat protein
MDSIIAAAARALAKGDALGALQRVALRDDPPALALRGIAMAQLGELADARRLLRRAARAFGSREAVPRARCAVAEAEVALALHDLAGTPDTLAAAASTLQAHGDHANAAHARLILVRRLLLVGQLADASALLDTLEARDLASPTLVATRELAAAEIAMRSLRTARAREALARARSAAHRAGVPALIAEADDAAALLDRPAARRWAPDGAPPLLRPAEVEALLASGTLVVDACRRGLRCGGMLVSLARRPVLFTLAHALAEGWPGDVERDALIARAFRLRRPDETHRARLRVEVGRLRAVVAPLAGIEATAHGFRLVPRDSSGLALLLPPIDGDEAALQALLADGAPWSTSALALALGASQRSVQRDLVRLRAAGKVRSAGRARAQRWFSAPITGFTTILLLPAALPFA